MLVSHNVAIFFSFFPSSLVFCFFCFFLEILFWQKPGSSNSNSSNWAALPSWKSRKTMYIHRDTRHACKVKPKALTSTAQQLYFNTCPGCVGTFTGITAHRSTRMQLARSHHTACRCPYPCHDGSQLTHHEAENEKTIYLQTKHMSSWLSAGYPELCKSMSSNINCCTISCAYYLIVHEQIFSHQVPSISFQKAGL